jgi:hypothetical protein
MTTRISQGDDGSPLARLAAAEARLAEHETRLSERPESGLSFQVAELKALVNELKETIERDAAARMEHEAWTVKQLAAQRAKDRRQDRETRALKVAVDRLLSVPVGAIGYLLFQQGGANGATTTTGTIVLVVLAVFFPDVFARLTQKPEALAVAASAKDEEPPSVTREAKR